MPEDPEDIFTKPITADDVRDTGAEAESADSLRREEPYFDIDTDIRPDTDPAIFHRRPKYARDEYGEYGSLFDPEEDSQIPPPLDGDEESQRLMEDLERKYREAEAEIIKETGTGDTRDDPDSSR